MSMFDTVSIQHWIECLHSCLVMCSNVSLLLGSRRFGSTFTYDDIDRSRLTRNINV